MDQNEASLSDSTILRIRNVVVYRLVDKVQVLVLNLDTNESFELDHLGAWVWSRINGSNSLGEIKEALSLEFGFKFSQFEEIFSALVTKLFLANLVEPRRDVAAPHNAIASIKLPSVENDLSTLKLTVQSPEKKAAAAIAISCMCSCYM
jgi:hypothetical protein